MLFFLSIFFSLFCLPVLSEGFVAGTLVKTMTGYACIENVSIGEKVISYDLQAGYTQDVVVNIIRRTTSVLIKLTIENAVIYTDCDQKFYLPVEKKWCPAGELMLGQYLRSLYRGAYQVQEATEFYQKSVLINGIYPLYGTTDVYFLTLEKYHNFCVSEYNIIVHNGFVFAAIPAAMSVFSYVASLFTTGVALSSAQASVAAVATVGVAAATLLKNSKSSRSSADTEKLKIPIIPPRSPKPKKNKKNTSCNKTEKKLGKHVLEEHVHCDNHEQARNKALECIADVDLTTGKPHIGTLGSGEGKITGMDWYDGEVTLRLDWDPQKGAHYNLTDWRSGKGMNGKKIAFIFPGDQEAVEALLRHLNSPASIEAAKSALEKAGDFSALMRLLESLGDVNGMHRILELISRLGGANGI